MNSRRSKKLLSCESLEDRRLLTTFEVTSLLDDVDANDGELTLREAILAANEAKDVDDIVFAPGLSGTIRLINGEFAVTAPMNLVGPGAALLTIDANGNDPTPEIDNRDGSRVLAIMHERRAEEYEVNVSGLTFTGADGDRGGAISGIRGSVRDCVFYDNASGNGGGAIIARSIEVFDSIFENNRTFYRGASGGAILAGNLTVERSIFHRNRALGNGGAIQANGEIIFRDTQFTNNRAYDDGGAAKLLYFRADVMPTITIENTTIANNVSESEYGGGLAIREHTDVTVTGSTISGNRQLNGGPGAGIHYRGEGTISIDRSTIVNNVGGWGAGGVTGFANTVVRNSIIAGNSDEQVSSLLYDVSHSIIGVAPSLELPPTSRSEPDVHGNYIGSVQKPIDPRLGELADNGNGILSHYPSEFSLAVDAGDPEFTADSERLAFDQRGAPYRRVANNRIDMGSIEITPVVAGDVDGDQLVNAKDVDLVCAAIRSGSDDLSFDLDKDQAVSPSDYSFLVEILLNTSYGDANLDGVFDSTDFILVFRSGTYEDQISGNSGWAQGDWNCDGDFGTSDLVVAFEAGSYQRQPITLAEIAAAMQTDIVEKDRRG